MQIVDWRDAPVSRVYYRYDEGDDYDEQFGGRMVEGEVLTRRSLAISGGQLRRIASPQGTFLRRSNGNWVRLGEGSQLSGGQGTAPRPVAATSRSASSASSATACRARTSTCRRSLR